MGCDIHFYVEKKVNNRWITADNWFEDVDEPGRFSTYKWGDGFTKDEEPFYTGRNYDLFSILADVRNGSGFAGCDTGEGFVPISDPRGLPDDVCEEVKRASDEYGCDGHSHSHLTVQELLEYDWTQQTKKRGFVSVKEFARYQLDGKPQSWSGGIGGGGVKIISPAEMIGHLQELAEGEKFNWRDFHNLEEGPMGMGSKFYTQIHWGVKYFESVGDFLSNAMPKLWSIGKPEEVRIVFWFDN